HRNIITATEFSNVSLHCSVLPSILCWGGPVDVKLSWHYISKNKTLQNSTKYTIRQHHIKNECKGRLESEFSLDIINVTHEDDGIYICQMFCPGDSEKGAIELRTVAHAQSNGTIGNIFSELKQPLLYWIVACVALSVFAVFLALFCALKKRKRSRKGRYNCNHQEEIVSDKLFISYSSKDFAWVTNNLITILEKHSISYTIHFRDFELGKPFIQNMADTVYGSRQVLIVLSDNYLASNFCREELHMAVEKRVYTGDSSLIIVLINKLKKKRLPFLLRNKNVLQFDEQMQKQHWEKKLIGKIQEKPISA
ncbi:unnamed protein product, partial [Porites lobata]